MNTPSPGAQQWKCVSGVGAISIGIQDGELVVKRNVFEAIRASAH